MLIRSFLASLVLCPLAASQSQVYFEGFLHTGLGQADLAVVGEQLHVTNIGSSGADGVHVDLGEAEGFSWGEVHDPAAIPLGASCTTTLRGDLDGIPGSVLARMNTVRTANGFTATPDFSSLGSTTYAVEIFDGPELVYSAGGFAGGVIEMDPPAFVDWFCTWCVIEKNWYYHQDVSITYHTPSGSVAGDRINFEPEGSSFTTAFLTDFEMLVGGGITEMHMLRELGFAAGVPHRALGVAHLEPRGKGCCITVSNIGSSGDDGVGIELSLAQRVDARWSPLDPLGGAPSGASLEALLRGLSDSKPDSELGAVSATKTAVMLVDLSADFSASGATAVEVEVLSGGVPVWTGSRPAGLVARVPSWPDGAVADRSPSSSSTWLWNVLLGIEVIGVGTFSGDGLRLTAEGATVAVGPLSRLELTLADLPELDLFMETVVPPTPLGTTYCTPAVPNSSGRPAWIRAIGSDVVLLNDVHLTARDLPPNQFGYNLASETQGFVANPGGSAGNLCLGGNIARLISQVQHSGEAGLIAIAVDLTHIPTSPPQAVQPGETWNFQTWFRDGMTSNFSDGVSVVFQ